MNKYREVSPSNYQRRKLLFGLAGAAASLAWLPPGPALAAVTQVSPRRLSLLHTHTAESLDVAYFDGSAYCRDSLSTLDIFLRDFRTGEAAYQFQSYTWLSVKSAENHVRAVRGGF